MFNVKNQEIFIAMPESKDRLINNGRRYPTYNRPLSHLRLTTCVPEMDKSTRYLPGVYRKQIIC